MQDGITMGTGNSRYLKSVSGFLALYPTYEAFAQALIAGTLPIDLNGKNADGWAQQGTPLNKANLLTDATAALLELSSEASPNDALAALAGKVNGTTLQALISSAPALTNSTVDGADCVGLSDTSAAEGKKITVKDLMNYEIRYGTSDLTAGSSPLPAGTIYLKYE